MKFNTNAEAIDTETRHKASEDARTFAMQTPRAAQEALLLDSHRAVTYLENRFVMSWEQSPLTCQ